MTPSSHLVPMPPPPRQIRCGQCGQFFADPEFFATEHLAMCPKADRRRSRDAHPSNPES